MPEDMLFHIKMLGGRIFEKDAERAARSVNEVGKQAKQSQREVGRLDQSLKTMGVFRWASYAGFATVATSIGAVTREALTFEDAMAKVKATTGVGAMEFNRLSSGALNMAQKYRATGAETANALYEITAAGISAGDAMGVLEGSLSLAAATGYDQAESAKLQVGLLNAYGLEATEMTAVADQLYQATAISGIGMEDLGYSMKYLAGPAKIANQSLEGVLETVALLGRAGMRGQNVGTGLATGLARLAAPTPEAIKALGALGNSFKVFQTSDGKLLSVQRIMEKVVDLTKNMTDVQKQDFLGELFGKDAADVWSTLLTLQEDNLDLVMQNRKEFRSWGGAAGEAAAIMNQTVNGALERLWGAITNITTSKFMSESGPIQGWLDGITARITAFDLNKWLQENEDTIDSLTTTGEAFATFLFDSLIPAFVELHNQLEPIVVPAMQILGEVLKYLAENGTLMMPIIAALTAMWAAQKAAAIATAAAGVFGYGIPGLGRLGKNGKGAGGTGKAGGAAAGGARGLAGRAIRIGGFALSVPFAAGLEASIAASPWVSKNVTNPLEEMIGTRSSTDDGRRGIGPRVRPPRMAALYQGDELIGKRHFEPHDRPTINLSVQIDGNEVARAAAKRLNDTIARR